MINSWLLYRRDCSDTGELKYLDLFDFKAQIAASLSTYARRRKVGRPSYSSIEHEHLLKRKRGPAAPIPEKSLRLDGINHLPEMLTDKGRCKLPTCTGIVRSKCTKCGVFLCLTSTKNCYKRFHEV